MTGATIGVISIGQDPGFFAGRYFREILTVASQQVAGHGCSGVVENFVLGLDLTDMTAKVTNQSAGDVLGGSIPLDTPIYAL